MTKLPGLRNRLIATANWLANYFTHDRKAGAVIDSVPLRGAATREEQHLRAKLAGLQESDLQDG